MEQPAVGFRVVFHPLLEQEGPRFAPAGITDENGEFQLQSYRPNDGAPAGDYVVTFSWPQSISTEDPDDAPRQIDRLRGRYDDPRKSQFRVTVREGKNSLEPVRAEVIESRAMMSKIAAMALLLAFGWAFVETGLLATLADRFQRPASKPTARLIEVLAETPEFRLVKHPLGETRVPITPRRIVCLTTSATDSLVALGITPVLVTTSWNSDRVIPYLDEALRHVPKIRPGEAINLEAVLAARPDLIFAGSARDGRLYGQLSKIAPTVCISSSTGGDRENRILDVGDVLGMTEQARARLAAFREHLAERVNSWRRTPRVGRQLFCGFAETPA